MAEEIAAPAAAAYAHGQDPIEVAVERVAGMIEVRDTVMKSREKSPGTFPVFGSTDTTVIGRRVVASLLNAGWRPPTDEDVVDAADRSRRASARLSQEQRSRALEYYSEKREFAPDLRPPG